VVLRETYHSRPLTPFSLVRGPKQASVKLLDDEPSGARKVTPSGRKASKKVQPCVAELADFMFPFLKGETLPIVVIPPTPSFLHRALPLNLVGRCVSTNAHPITHMFNNGASLENRFGGAQAYGGDGKCTAYFGQCEGVLGEVRHYQHVDKFAVGIQYQVGTSRYTNFVDLTEESFVWFVNEIVREYNKVMSGSVGELHDGADYTASVALNTLLEMLLPEDAVDGYIAQSARTTDPDGVNFLFKGEPEERLPINVDARRIVLPADMGKTERDALLPPEARSGERIQMEGKEVLVDFAPSEAPAPEM
jgi:hypothetical protein